MPEKTGLESITQLKSKDIKTIMLTGQMPSSDAIENLNEKIFDAYISKQRQDAVENITELLERAKHAYFKEAFDLTIANNSLVRRMYVAGKHNDAYKRNMKLSKVLTDKGFSKFFTKFVDDGGFCESYLIDEFGSFALFDKHMKAALLAVIHNDEIEDYYQKALMADQKPDEDVLNLIKERKAFPFFYGHDIAPIEPKAWGRYLVPAIPVEGSAIFYSPLDDVKKYGIETDGLRGYAEFLASQDPFQYA